MGISEGEAPCSQLGIFHKRTKTEPFLGQPGSSFSPCDYGTILHWLGGSVVCVFRVHSPYRDSNSFALSLSSLSVISEGVLIIFLLSRTVPSTITCGRFLPTTPSFFGGLAWGYLPSGEGESLPKGFFVLVKVVFSEPVFSTLYSSGCLLPSPLLLLLSGHDYFHQILGGSTVCVRRVLWQVAGCVGIGPAVCLEFGPLSPIVVGVCHFPSSCSYIPSDPGYFPLALSRPGVSSSRGQLSFPGRGEGSHCSCRIHQSSGKPDALYVIVRDMQQ